MQPDLHTSLCVESPNHQVLAGRNKILRTKIGIRHVHRIDV